VRNDPPPAIDVESQGQPRWGLRLDGRRHSAASAASAAPAFLAQLALLLVPLHPLDPAVNEMQMHWQFSVDARGTLYFNARSPAGFGEGDIYSSRFEDGHYLKPENCGTGINTEQDEATPFISPDGSYLLFQRSLDLYISFRRPDGKWTQARSLGTPINSPGNELCPVVTPDGKYIFFLTTRGGENQAFWVDAGIIERMREEIRPR